MPSQPANHRPPWPPWRASPTMAADMPGPMPRVGTRKSKSKTQNHPYAMSTATSVPAPLTANDFASDQDVRWCPGCGDYAILQVMKKVLPQIGVPREQIV